METLDYREIVKDIISKYEKDQAEEDLLSVFDRIGENAQAKGLTEEILEQLLSDES
ncbi:MAG: hypothetical protein HCA05_10350 [Dolichospermum sp. DET68]